MADVRESARRAPRGESLVFGWREWVALPRFGIARIKAKVDTGSRTSVLRAANLHSFRRSGQPWARFDIQPLQRDSSLVRCEAPVVDHREVKRTDGEIEDRVVIETTIAVAGREWPIELTLTNRQDMRFHMRLGRAALRGHGIVNPGKSYLLDSAGS